MKLNPKQTLTRPAISEYLSDVYNEALERPNPPTQEMIDKAQFVDKTYVWKNGSKEA